MANVVVVGAQWGDEGKGKIVDVQRVQASEDGDQVQVRLVYRRTDGTTSTENKVEGLVEDGAGGWLIDTDQPAG